MFDGNLEPRQRTKTTPRKYRAFIKKPIPRELRKFLRAFSLTMIVVLRILGCAFVIAAALVIYAPDDGLKTEALVPLWVIIGMWWVGLGMFYLWFSERLSTMSKVTL